MASAYPEVSTEFERLSTSAYGEEEAFLRTLAAGTEILDLAVLKTKKAEAATLPGDTAFLLHDTFGFPIDLTLEIAEEAGLTVDRDAFDKLMSEQRTRAKTDAKAKKGAIADLAIYSDLRSKGETSVTDADGNTVDRFSTTANRYDTGASVGYKFDPRSYIVTAARYEHDDFGANLWQGIVSVGYGYIALKNDRAELSFEVGPGYKRYQPAKSTRPELNADGTPVVDPVTGAAVSVPYTPNTEGEVVGRSLINGKYRLTENTALEDTLLIEAGSKNQYYQNDIGLSVSMTKKMALKLGYQIRYNSDIQPGTVSTDKLMTTNLVYNF
jgi:putative salt-induced outer membrane protein